MTISWLLRAAWFGSALFFSSKDTMVSCPSWHIAFKSRYSVAYIPTWARGSDTSIWCLSFLSEKAGHVQTTRGLAWKTVPSVSVRKQSCTAAKSGVDCIAPTFHKKCRHLGTDDSYANTRFNFVSSALIWVFPQAITWERMATLESTFLEVLTKDRNGATHSHSQNRSPNFDSLQRPRSMVDICLGLTWLRMLRDDLQHESGSLKAPDRLEHHGINYGTKKRIT